jgi:hypothetical protein
MCHRPRKLGRFFIGGPLGSVSGPPKETAPARGQAEAEVEAGVPHIGTIAMWVSYPPIPLNSFSEIREWPKILAWRQLEPSARYDAAMNAEGLFQVEPV